jgi:AbrB family looped-hinge helix DNA binding protein
MRARIDGEGRVMVPKAIRDRLGFAPGAEVELTESDEVLEIAPVTTRMRLVQRDGHLVAQADREMPTLTAHTVRDVVERIRRSPP